MISFRVPRSPAPGATFFLLLTVLAALVAFMTGPALARGPRVVASTSWAAAYARAAGAADVRSVCPASVMHPPDYDPRPSDLALVAHADFLLLGGFEGFAERMAESADSKATIVHLNLLNTRENVETEVLRLGKILGTEDCAERYVLRFREEVARLRSTVRQAYAGRKQVAAAQKFVRLWGDFAGIEVAGYYGPGPLKPTDLPRMAALRPALILDNAHMPCGGPIAEACGAQIVQMINFPGPKMELLDVFRENARRLLRAAQVLSGQIVSSQIPSGRVRSGQITFGKILPGAHGTLASSPARPQRL